MDVQNEILDYLGDQASTAMLHEDFDGLNQFQILAKLNEWFPTENNESLAVKIYDFLRASSAAASLGALGGKSTSETKRKSSAANGKLGGRPKKNK